MAQDEDASPRRAQLPWSAEGHYTDELRRGREPELMRVIREAEGKGIFGSTKMTELPAWQMLNATHNPYWNIALGVGGVWVGTFVFSKLSDSIWLAILAGGFLVLSGIWIVLTQAGRVPGWHRARRAAKCYLAMRGGGKLPPEVRIFT